MSKKPKNSKEKVDHLYLARVITNLHNSHIGIFSANSFWLPGCEAKHRALFVKSITTYTRHVGPSATALGGYTTQVTPFSPRPQPRVGEGRRDPSAPAGPHSQLELLPPHRPFLPPRAREASSSKGAAMRSGVQTSTIASRRGSRRRPNGGKSGLGSHAAAGGASSGGTGEQRRRRASSLGPAPAGAKITGRGARPRGRENRLPER